MAKHLRQTLITAVALLVLGIFFYWLSTVTAVSEVQGARRLADVAQKTLEQTKSGDAVEDAVLLELHHLEHRDFWKELFLHLAIAVFVAIGIVFIVEIHSRRRMEDEAHASQRRVEEEMTHYRDLVAQNVFEALYKRSLPGDLVKEVEAVLKSDAVREQVNYKLTFFRYEGMSPDFILIERKLVYVTRNITGRALSGHKFRSSIISSVGPFEVQLAGETVKLPRHLELVIGEKKMEIPQPHATVLEYAIDIDETVRVVHTIQEPKRTRDSNSYTVARPVTGLTVRIDNRLENELTITGVELLLPPDKRFRFDEATGLYQYPGALLPGQTFIVTWEPKPPA